jgi:hypothetical protein
MLEMNEAPEPADSGQDNKPDYKDTLSGIDKLPSCDKIKAKWNRKFEKARDEARSPLVEALKRITGQ